MSEKTGEIARESSDYRCECCYRLTRIAQGVLIPACPHCGHGSYGLFNPRLARNDGAPEPREPGRMPG